MSAMVPLSLAGRTPATMGVAHWALFLPVLHTHIHIDTHTHAQPESGRSTTSSWNLKALKIVQTTVPSRGLQ